MKKMIVMSQKGGVGKTTSTINLSVAAMKAGHNVVVIDLDPQASATRWSDNREDDVPVVVSAHTIRLPEVLHARGSRWNDTGNHRHTTKQRP